MGSLRGLGPWLIAALLLWSPAGWADSPPTASFLGNGQAGQVTVPVDSSVTLSWQATNAVQASSSYTVSPAESCPGASGTGPWPWVATSLAGSVTLTAQPCHAGHTYTLTYTAMNAQGQQASATLAAVVPQAAPAPAPPPTAMFRGDGQTGQITVPVGSAVTLSWEAMNAAQASSTYSVSPAESCSDSAPGTGPWPWIATSLAGSVTLIAQPCHAGHTYTLTYTAWNAHGQQASATLAAVVPMPAAPPPPPPPAPGPVVSTPPPDTTPPVGTIAINDHAAYTTSTTVTLSFFATDHAGAVTQMQCSNDGRTYVGPEPYTTTRTWSLSPGDGPKNVYVRFGDRAGNWSAPARDEITVDTLAPTVRVSYPTDGMLLGAANMEVRS